MGQLHKGESRRLQGDGVKKTELFLGGFFKVGNVGDLVLPPWVIYSLVIRKEFLGFTVPYCFGLRKLLAYFFRRELKKNVDSKSEPSLVDDCDIT
jgi:hypothetical protein